MPTGWVFAVVAFGLTLLLWIVMAFSMLLFEFARLREFWLTPQLFGVSNFWLAVLLGGLLAMLLTAQLFAGGAVARSRRWAEVAAYGGLMAILGAYASVFSEMARIPLNDAWFYEAIKSEPFDWGRTYLGQIVERVPCSDCPAAESAVLVELETWERVRVQVPTQFSEPERFLLIDELQGRYTGELDYALSRPMYVYAEDSEYFKRRRFEQVR